MVELQRHSGVGILVHYARALATVAGVFCIALSSTALASTPADTAGEIRNLLTQLQAPDIDPGALNLPALRGFYTSRLYEPAWSGGSQAVNKSQSMISALEHADEEGLNPLDYHAGSPLFHDVPSTKMEQAERDIILTDGALRYARDLRNGRADLRMLDRDVELPDQPFDEMAALNAALKSTSLTDFLAGLAPPQSIGVWPPQGSTVAV
jgi:murein L,D-transpeptidase YcbB/YkuD